MSNLTETNKICFIRNSKGGAKMTEIEAILESHKEAVAHVFNKDKDKCALYIRILCRACYDRGLEDGKKKVFNAIKDGIKQFE